jgi:hypothetical protein
MPRSMAETLQSIAKALNAQGWWLPRDFIAICSIFAVQRLLYLVQPFPFALRTPVRYTLLYFLRWPHLSLATYSLLRDL